MSFLFVLLRDQYFLKIKNNKILPFGRNGVLQYWGEIFKLFRTCFYKLKIIVLMRKSFWVLAVPMEKFYGEILILKTINKYYVFQKQLHSIGTYHHLWF
jgi:hypothetical protein